MSEPTVRLGDVATARSGDKGNHANIGVVVLDPANYLWLIQVLTADRVLQHFPSLGITKVERFELPHAGALNFLLHNALAGGASQSLRIDTQGKLLGTALLDIELSTTGLPAHPD